MSVRKKSGFWATPNQSELSAKTVRISAENSRHSGCAIIFLGVISIIHSLLGFQRFFVGKIGILHRICLGIIITAIMRERIDTEGRNSRDPGLPSNAVIFRAIDPFSTGPPVGLEDALRAGLSCIATGVNIAATFIIGLEAGGVITGHPPGTVTARIFEDVRRMIRGDSNSKPGKKKRK